MSKLNHPYDLMREIEETIKEVDSRLNQARRKGHYAGRDLEIATLLQAKGAALVAMASIAKPRLAPW